MNENGSGAPAAGSAEAIPTLLAPPDLSYDQHDAQLHLAALTISMVAPNRALPRTVRSALVNVRRKLTAVPIKDYEEQLLREAEQ